jgi:hypothetical protein
MKKLRITESQLKTIVKGIIKEERKKQIIKEGILSGGLDKIKNAILDSPLFDKLINTIVANMTPKNIQMFKMIFNLQESVGGPSLESIMTMVHKKNPDKNLTAAMNEEQAAIDKESLEGKVVNLVRNVTGLNLLALGGLPLGLLINSIINLGPYAFGSFLGPLISLIASLIIHGISRKLIGVSSDEGIIGEESQIMEMSRDDVNLKAILAKYDSSSETTQKAIANMILGSFDRLNFNPKMARVKIYKELRDMDYQEISGIRKRLNIR